MAAVFFLMFSTTSMAANDYAYSTLVEGLVESGEYAPARQQLANAGEDTQKAFRILLDIFVQDHLTNKFDPRMPRYAYMKGEATTAYDQWAYERAKAEGYNVVQSTKQPNNDGSTTFEVCDVRWPEVFLPNAGGDAILKGSQAYSLSYVWEKAWNEGWYQIRDPFDLGNDEKMQKLPVKWPDMNVFSCSETCCCMIETPTDKFDPAWLPGGKWNVGQCQDARGCFRSDVLSMWKTLHSCPSPLDIGRDCHLVGWALNGEAESDEYRLFSMTDVQTNMQMLNQKPSGMSYIQYYLRNVYPTSATIREMDAAAAEKYYTEHLHFWYRVPIQGYSDGLLAKGIQAHYDTFMMPDTVAIDGKAGDTVGTEGFTSEEVTYGSNKNYIEISTYAWMMFPYGAYYNWAPGTGIYLSTGGKTIQAYTRIDLLYKLYGCPAGVACEQYYAELGKVTRTNQEIYGEEGPFTESILKKLLGFTVTGREKWQNTGMAVKAGNSLKIYYVDGRWTANPATGMVDANGNPAKIAKSGYTLPGKNEGALIGKVGETRFLIGNTGTVPSGLTGMLELAINDDWDGRYGAGFSDNEGSIIVYIDSVHE